MQSANGIRRIRRHRWLRITGLVAASLIIVVCLMALYFVETLPTFAEIINQNDNLSQSTRIYDRTGTILLYQINSSGGAQRTVVPFDQVPQSLKDATLAIEDSNFYNEPAFDLQGILRAFLVDVTTGSFAEGGSTITQQLARTAFLNDNRTITRKLKELILAIRLNQYYSKDQIFDLYLNEAPYGPNISGVEAASEAYFGEPVTGLNLPQSALLAALPQAPSYYSPWGSHVDELVARAHLVLQRMYALGEITEPELGAALKYKYSFQPRSSEAIKAPHFVLAVEDYLVKKYGEAMVDTGGLKVITTLDWNLQQDAEQAVAWGAARNQELYGGYNAALVAEDPTTGQILAMVGSRNYFASSSLPVGCTPGVNCKFEPNFNVATQALRQPGSSLKPFVYLTAFQEGYTPDTVLWDVPTEFSTNPACPEVPDMNSINKLCFHPTDFDPFQGPISMRDALAQSVNVAAVKTLYLAGMKPAIANMQAFGLKTLTSPDQYGLSLVLGGGAVRLVDLAKAYSVLADDGVKHAQSMVLQVQAPDGKILESYTDKATRVADPQSVRLVNDVLSDPVARSGLFKSGLGLTTVPGYDVALKTGTSNDYRDTWASGYTPNFVASVWAGNNDNTPMQRNGSSLLAAVPMWHMFMESALKEFPPESFPAPSPVTTTKPILNGNYTYQNQLHSILYYVNPADPLGPPPTDPNADPQFRNWEAAVQAWASKNFPNYGTYNQPVPVSGAASGAQGQGAGPSASVSPAAAP